MIRRIALSAAWFTLMTVHIGFAQQPAVIPAAQLQPAIPATAIQPATPLQPAQVAAEATVEEAAEPIVDAAVDSAANETADSSAGEASNAVSSDQDAAAKAKQAALDAKIEAEKTKLKTERTQFKQQRLQQIKQLQFDRRMSSALQVWSTPDADKLAAEKEAEKQRLEAEAKAKAQAAEAADDSTAPVADELPTEIVQLRTEFEAEKKAFTESLQAFQEAVTLGKWAEVKAFLDSLEQEEQDAALNQLLTSLAAGPAGPQMPTADQMPLVDPAILAAAMAARGQGPGARFRETNFFALGDIEGLLRCCPNNLEDAQVMRLGQIIRQSINAGHDVESLVRRFEEETNQPSDTSPMVDKRLAAKLLFAAGQSQHAGSFLPTADEAVASNDREGLNLLARYAYDAYQKENKKELLVQAWEATQAVLAAGEVDPEEKNEALKRAVELAPKVAEELGQAWLDESFTKRMERGKEILGTIGSTAATAMQTRPTDAQYRLKILQLQKTAVDALIQAAPELAQDWQTQLNLLAMNWLKEAEYTQQQAQTSSMNAMLRRDVYGNYYYSEDYDYNSRRMSGQSSPIETPDMLENRPTDDWLALLSPSIQPKFQMIFAQLYLKVNEEEKAFPFIEAFAQSQPEKALDLAHEFLRVWTENHNPNQNRGRTNYYMFMYGYDQRADQ
ncbi:MAG: hypothetical protein KDA87_20390, partial [Planctomycetales bacterium]|nr:hypothetical protein [Planctomycetales bacterium]